MSIPAAKGFAKSTTMSLSNAADTNKRTRTNRSGGIQGGISNGETIVVAFKPTSMIGQLHCDNGSAL
jgi:chorismate synthase